MKPTKTARPLRARDAFAANATEIRKLLTRIEARLAIDEDDKKLNWGDVGSSRHAISCLLEAAHSVGAMTDEEFEARF